MGGGGPLGGVACTLVVVRLFAGDRVGLKKVTDKTAREYDRYGPPADSKSAQLAWTASAGSNTAVPKPRRSVTLRPRNFEKRPDCLIRPVAATATATSHADGAFPPGCATRTDSQMLV